MSFVAGTSRETPNIDVLKSCDRNSAESDVGYIHNEQWEALYSPEIYVLVVK